jgi:hypothetical protein
VVTAEDEVKFASVVAIEVAVVLVVVVAGYDIVVVNVTGEFVASLHLSLLQKYTHINYQRDSFLIIFRLF